MNGVLKFLVGVPRKMLGLFTKENLAKADKIAQEVNDLLPYAIDAIEFVSKLTPNRTDDEIVAVLKQLETPLEIVSPLSKTTKNALLLSAAHLALRGQVANALVEVAGAGLRIGGAIVKDETGIPDSIVDLAVQSAYTLLSKAAVKAEATPAQ